MAEYDPEREDRISEQVLVDTYDGDEEAMGWYYYLEDHLNFPFAAEWDGEIVKVLSMSSEEDCGQDMIVEVRIQEGGEEDEFSVPLKNLNPIDIDEATAEAIADWNYWLNQGNSLELTEDDDDY
jgi:hypothetical protein